MPRLFESVRGRIKGLQKQDYSGKANTYSAGTGLVDLGEDARQQRPMSAAARNGDILAALDAESHRCARDGAGG